MLRVQHQNVRLPREFIIPVGKTLYYFEKIQEMRRGSNCDLRSTEARRPEHEPQQGPIAYRPARSAKSGSISRASRTAEIAKTTEPPDEGTEPNGHGEFIATPRRAHSCRVLTRGSTTITKKGEYPG